MKATIPQGLPATGWWLDNDPIHCYHGTFSPKLPNIFEKGLIPGSSGLCYVSPSYSTAATFSQWGAEGIDAHISRTFRDGLKIYPANHYAVVHFNLPRSFIEQHGIYRRERDRWLPKLKIPKLAERSLYDAFTGSDEEYYYMQEVKFDRPLPAEWITAVSFPYI